jgi:hypothetical protein
MQHFQQVATGIDVALALAQLELQPGLWGANPARTEGEASPHSETQDIWLRFRDPAELTSRVAYGEPHFGVFYPAWDALTALKPIVFDIMARMKAVYLGGILITRIPPGGQVKAHHDRGSWHAEWLNSKVYVVLQANDLCVNWCEGDRLTMRAGEAWQFENQRMHGVINGGDEDRIALIITMRVEG